MSSGIKQQKGSRTISDKDIKIIARALGIPVMQRDRMMSPIGDAKRKPPVAKSRLTEEGKKLVKNKKQGGKVMKKKMMGGGKTSKNMSKMRGGGKTTKNMAKMARGGKKSKYMSKMARGGTKKSK